MLSPLVFLRFQGPGKALLLALVVVFKFPVVPVEFKGRRDLVNGFRQVLLRDLGIPLQTAGQRGVGKIGGAHVGRRKAGVTVEDVGLCVQTGRFRVIADLDFRVGQLAQLLDGLHVRGPHVGGRDDPKFAAVLGELFQLIYDQPQAAPFDEGNQHIDPVAGDDFLFEFRVHLRLMGCTGKQRALGNRGLRAGQFLLFAQRQAGVLLFQQCQQLLSPLCYREPRQLRLLRLFADGRHDLIDQLHLRAQISALVLDVCQPLLHNLGHILRQHLCRFRGINRRSLTELVRHGKLLVKSGIDDLFIKAVLQHTYSSGFPFVPKCSTTIRSN